METKKIIHTYLLNAMPRAVQQQFETWCLEKDRVNEIDDPLKAEWDQLDPAAILPTDAAHYRLKLDRLHRETKMLNTPQHRPLQRFVAAAAVIGLLLMAVEFFVVKHFVADNTVCLVTAENSKGKFLLPDGSVVWLNADTRLTYSERFAQSGIRGVKLSGEAFFDVKRDSLHPFQVTMGDLKVRVLGTRFNACCITSFGTEEVTLQSGAVEITSEHIAESVLLSPNQHYSYNTESGVGTVSEVNASNYYSWLNDSVIFNNQLLSDILVNIEHKCNIRFQIDSDVDTSVRLSFTLYPESLEETLRVIETLAHVHCCPIDKNHVWISK